MDKTAIQWPTIVTAIVAVIGAVISAYTLWLNRKEKKRQVKVELSLGLLTYDSPQTSPPMLLISASNSGNRSVTLNSPGIILPNKKQVIFPRHQSHVQYPYDLQEGKNCTTWTDAKELAESLRNEGFFGKIKLVGFYRDGVGKIYKSPSIKFDLNEW